jgi:2'-5' RNA ligase
MEDQSVQKVYFIGIALPPELDEQIARLKWRLFDTSEAALRPLLPHITLVNPPSLRGIMPDELIPKVREIAVRYLPLTITLDRVDMFGGQVCYIHAESLGLLSLQSQLVSLLSPEAQAVQNKRTYSPHVTLLQVYDPETIDHNKTTEIISQAIELPITFTVDSVTCFKRILPREYYPEMI